MSSQKGDPSDITRGRIIRQTPRPRVSLTDFSKNSGSHSAPDVLLGINDTVKIRNRFQHSQNDMLSYSNSISNQPRTNVLRFAETVPELDAKRMLPKPSLPNEDTRGTFGTVSVDRAPGLNNICSMCHANAIVYERNMRKCHNCGMFSLLKTPPYGSPLGAKSFYGKETFPTQRSLPEGNLINSSWKSTADLRGSPKPSPRRKPAKAKVKDKVCLTISSDEEDSEFQKHKTAENSEAANDKEASTTEQSPLTSENDVTQTDCTKEQPFKIPKLSDRMKPQGGKTAQDSSPESAPGLAAAHPPCLLSTTEQGFQLNISYVQLGSLPGKAMTSLSLKSNALRIEVECSFEILEGNKKKRMSEKYKLALSSVEVSQIFVKYESERLVLAVVPSKQYSDIVNKALSKCILDAQSDELIKRRIEFFVNSEKGVFKRTLEQTLPHLQRIAPVKVYLDDKNTQTYAGTQKESGSKYFTRSTPSSQKEPKVVKTIFVYPPPPKKGGIALTNVDVDCLEPGIYLNDIIIDFYLKWLYEEKLSPQQKAKTYIFNSYFYTRLSKRAFGDARKNEDPMQRMHAQVKKWTRDVDIFERDFILIPVNEHSHWFLVIICFPSRIEIDEAVEGSGLNENASSDSVEDSQLEIRGLKEDSKEQLSKCTDEIAAKTAGDNEKQKSCSEDMLMDVDEENSRSMQHEAASCSKSEGSPPEVNKGQQTEENSRDSNSSTGKSCGPSENPDAEYNSPSVKCEQPCILVFDSLVSGGRSRVFSNLRNYLTLEWKEKRKGLEAEKVFTKNNLKGSFPKIPLQSNDCDCGVYILQYAESFFQDPILNYNFPIKKEKWFTKEQVDGKRESIKKTISDLEQNLPPGNSAAV